MNSLRDQPGELASLGIAFFSLFILFFAEFHTLGKEYVVHLDVNPINKPVESLLEADEFVFKMVLGKGLFKEDLDGKISPDLARDPYFNPISGQISFKLKRSFWSNGEEIKSSCI